ncbi:fungal specific transcription factor domain-containing protein [Colletotrichum orchidophilum]|uniref:Fungal specific transcription factor domain-containing protein n=1 Tax=Colletotrichum orchidophilum TaxID=1209926 RepID=A0A1G4BJP5_9PEZI|nr:fungal specific transcription factor domain-containing protein [Colletotrichum orchidophilum]OHF01507.1 fungal specific transcription factor domain-containing protein [Colletotrichum orchidophilum]
METSSQRRKACDLCFLKKIKCDMLKPACSNCLLYKSECRTTTVRRRAVPTKERQQRPKESAAEDPKRVGELESRLAKIEEQLQRALDANIRLSSQVPAPAPAPVPLQSTPITDSIELPLDSGGDSTDSAEFINAFSCSESPSEWVVEPEKPKLPPLEEIMPVIDEFFSRYNSIMPLFDQPTFMRMLSDWYLPSSCQSSAVWAAINIALALGYRCTLKEVGNLDALVDDQKVLHHMRNVQSVVSDLVTREDDLLGIQVLVGMVVLFQGTKDPKPASVLIGTAIRLAHRMHLHDKESLQYFPAAVGRQRSRLFWMAYCMDKDISLKAKTPSFQLDADIDLPLPELDPDDGAGIMAASNGSKFNFFRARVELSHIAGKVYDLLYSTRARKVAKGEAQLRVTRLGEMVDTWRRNVPSEFQLESLLENVEPLPAVHLSLLYHNYFVITVMTHGIYSHDADWVQRISSFSRATIQALEGLGSPFSRPIGSLPTGWASCVELSRSCMKLFVESPKTDCSIWSNACAHFSGLIILLSNMFVFPEHPHLMTDKELAEQALQLFDMMLRISANDNFRKLHEVARELHRRAMATVDKVARKRDEQAAAAAVVEAMDNALPFGMQFEEDVIFFGGTDMADFEGPFAGGAMEESPVTIGSDAADSLADFRGELGRAAVTVGHSHY